MRKITRNITKSYIMSQNKTIKKKVHTYYIYIFIYMCIKTFFRMYKKSWSSKINETARIKNKAVQAKCFQIKVMS